MSIDNAGDPNGRSAYFKFDDRRYPCEEACGWPKTTTIPADFVFDSPVAARYVEFDSWGSTEPDSGFLFDFLTMETGRPYYVGMSIRFRVTLTGGIESNEYNIGYSGALVEVTASGAEGGQPTSWIIRSVDPLDPKFNDCSRLRDLARQYRTGSGKGAKYSNQCYGWYHIPFEMDLSRIS